MIYIIWCLDTGTNLPRTLPWQCYQQRARLPLIVKFEMRIHVLRNHHSALKFKFTSLREIYV